MQNDQKRTENYQKSIDSISDGSKSDDKPGFSSLPILVYEESRLSSFIEEEARDLFYKLGFETFNGKPLRAPNTSPLFFDEPYHNSNPKADLDPNHDDASLAYDLYG